MCKSLGASLAIAPLTLCGLGVRPVSALAAFPSQNLNTFRGSPSRSVQGFGPVPRNPRVRWSFQTGVHYERVGKSKRSWKGTGWSGQSAVADGRIYVPGLDGVCYCRNSETGESIWTFTAGDSIKGSISLWGDRLLFGSRDNHLYCLAREDGHLLWRMECGGKDVDSTPAVLGDYAWFGGEDQFLYCVTRDGEVRWRQKTSGSIESSPAVGHGVVLIGSFDGYLHCFSQDSGEPKWRFPTGDDTDSSPVIIDDRVYLGCENGMLYSLHLQTGKRIWRYRAAAGIWGTPAVVDGHIFIGDDAGVFHCLDAVNGTRTWTTSIGAGTWASPTVVDGCVVIGDWVGTLHCLDASTGKRVWAREHDNTYIVSSAAIHGGRIYIGVRDGTVYCLEETPSGESI